MSEQENKETSEQDVKPRKVIIVRDKQAIRKFILEKSDQIQRDAVLGIYHEDY